MEVQKLCSAAGVLEKLMLTSVVNTFLVAQKSYLLVLLLSGALLIDSTMLPSPLDTEKRFPFGDVKKASEPVEPKDASDSDGSDEDGTDEDSDDADDDDEDDEYAGEGSDDGDSDGGATANGADGGSDDEDDDDDDDEDGEDDDDEDDDDEDSDDEEDNRPSKKKK